ncbi:phosphoribosylglycinamide formyltransferase [Pseudonocardia endophytica]|uniref:Phosphoribosylglycinamide formyltransferase n=1 Tax=Pseudonocardia endophytica TaxID=401976 RepID=A0A4R1HSP9_PSEEN|nr:phosphoribosylglycinamide formyltransferase [Pseudonocardia endophytica]TCK20422.1 phosphoribosylglycinamide formyltransferase-1 [Pseudonocardia endophytica]
MPAHRCRLVVLLSGDGSLFQALLDACAAPDMPAAVVAAGSDRAGAGGLGRARGAGVPTFVERTADHPDRVAWDAALLARVREHRPDLVVGAGFMKLVSPAFLDGIGCWMINSHPALLPAFPGAHAVRDALAAGVDVTGATVHVVDAGTDTGPVLDQVPVEVRDGDTEATLHERIKVAERRLLVDVVRRLAGEIHTSPRGGPSDEMSGLS